MFWEMVELSSSEKVLAAIRSGADSPPAIRIIWPDAKDAASVEFEIPVATSSTIVPWVLVPFL